MECPECQGAKRIEYGCPRCNGSGEGMADGATCVFCRGSGSIGEQDCGLCEGKGFLSCSSCDENKDGLRQTFYGYECAECIALAGEYEKDTADDR